MKIAPGLRIKFPEEKQAYTVQASNDRYTICTKPFNPKRTVIYTIVDWVKKVRGPEDLIFGFGAETRRQCQAMLQRLVAEESGVSHRHRIDLKIQEIKI
jgi:hypothetical protein